MDMYEVQYNGAKIGLVRATDSDDATTKANQMCQKATQSQSGALYGQVIDASNVVVMRCANQTKYDHMR